MKENEYLVYGPDGHPLSLDELERRRAAAQSLLNKARMVNLGAHVATEELNWVGEALKRKALEARGAHVAELPEHPDRASRVSDILHEIPDYTNIDDSGFLRDLWTSFCDDVVNICGRIPARIQKFLGKLFFRK